ncbi:MAG: DUF3078 domain-containing protein [Muribaculaceae bacterium]|nr:DUF3078 domain-containing protein [Muribaculaceae bacterium]
MQHFISPLLISAAAMLPALSAAAQDCGCSSPQCISDSGECDCHCEHFRFTFEDLHAETEQLSQDPVIADYYRQFPVKVFEPRIFSGFRTLTTPTFAIPPLKFEMDARQSAYDRDQYAGILYTDPQDIVSIEEDDEILILGETEPSNPDGGLQQDSITPMQAFLNEEEVENFRNFNPIPQWLAVALRAERMHQDLIYRLMTSDPATIQYAYWDLPVPPRLPEEDHSFAAFVRNLDLPPVADQIEASSQFTTRHINWLHNVGTGLQLSQAFISSNWYQGGNNYLAVLFNFNWNVTLNTVFHPNLMLVSDLSYKLAINSNPKTALHKYSISQDQFQYSLKAGLKAFNKWFYSISLLFKTQFFNNYPADSDILGAKFLSPSEFNAGLGMTYNTKALKDHLNLSLSIAPLSYNLKACPSMRIDHTQFNILPDRKTRSEIGSSAELNLNWDITSNISWKSRVFLFTNYQYFQADWENTFNFTINRFLSTQLYVYPRFDSSSDRTSSNWRYWQLKEILSFGLSYTFSTKP